MNEPPSNKSILHKFVFREKHQELTCKQGSTLDIDYWLCLASNETSIQLFLEKENLLQMHIVHKNKDKYLQHGTCVILALQVMHSLP